MKNKKFLMFICLVLYFVVITLSCVYIITSGVKNINEASKIKELTFDEKTKLIDEINDKYVKLENETIEKYSPNIQDINDKYKKNEDEINSKYDVLEQEIKDNYDKKEKEINNKINDNNVLKNKEFFANGLSKRYYELSDIGSELYNEKSELTLKERKEINNNKLLKNNELKENNNSKDNELKSIENNKNMELTRLKQSKDNEINSINNRNNNKGEIRYDGIKNIIFGCIIIFIPIVYVIIIFNKLTRLSNSVKEKWSQVDVYLKQRSDLIPNIVEVVKGYSTHEKNTLTKITRARNQVIKASTKEEEINANKSLENEVGRLLVLQEDYPELKANENFIRLQQELSEVEDNISILRQQYNTAVLKYKNKLEMFPSNIIASLFNFKTELFFEIGDNEKENVNISF